MFAMTIKNPKPGEKYDNITISIVYVNENLIKDKSIKIIDEKVLTHRAKVEIKDVG